MIQIKINISFFSTWLMIATVFGIIDTQNVNAQTWANTSNLQTARTAHTMELLANGNVLIIAGATSAHNNGLTSCEVFNPSTNTISTTGSLNRSRYYHATSTLSNGKILVSGGYGGSYLTSCELYDTSTKTWSNTGSLTNRRYGHTSTLLNNGLVLVTGGHGGSNLSSCELYNPSTGTWSSTGSLPNTIWGHTATLLPNGKVLVVGGATTYFGYNIINSCALYDPSTGQWSATGSMSTSRVWHNAILLKDGKVLVSGGLNSATNYHKTCEIYDPSTGNWSSTGSMITRRSERIALLLNNGAVMVSGGINVGGYLDSCEIYDPNTQTWSLTGKLNGKRGGVAILLSNGQVFISGGSYNASSNAVLNTCEIYSPESEANCNKPTLPAIKASSNTVCEGQSVILSIDTGSLMDATHWQWYSGTCNGTKIDTGLTITVTPLSNTTYFVRGEGACGTPVNCASIAISVNSVPILNPVSDITIETPAGTCTYPVYFNATSSGNPAPQLNYYIEDLYNYGPFEYEVFSGDRFDPHYAYGYPTPASINVIASNVCGSDTDQFIVTLFGKKVAMQCYGDEIFTLDSGETTYVDYSNGHGVTPGTHTILGTDILNHCGFGGGPYYIFTGATQSNGFTDLHTTPFNVGTTRVTAFAYDEYTGFFLDDYLFVENKIDSILWQMADSCFFYITILKRPVDIIQCVNDLAVNPNHLGSRYLVSSTQLDPVRLINRSSIKSITNNFNYNSTLNGAQFKAGTTRILWTATDTADQTDTCSFSITVNHCGAAIPPGAKPFNSNKAISTQSEMNSFYDQWSGEKWTKIEGNLTINGNNNEDPITDFCNLRELTEVTGHLLIQQFTKPNNPTTLQDLAGIVKVGRLTIITCPKFDSISFPELTQTSGSVIIRNNVNVKTISLPKLQIMGGSWLHFQRNHRLENLSVSNNTSALVLTDNKAGIDIQKNGDSTTNPLTIDLKKINVVKGDLIFSMNKNSGVGNFDNIFSGLDSVKGKLTITDNSYLSKCCIAASTSVLNGRTISGNIGNCADLNAVSNDCGTLYKRSELLINSEDEFLNTVSFNVYPNPNKGFFRLDVNTSQSGTLKITLTDLLGRTVWTQSENVIVSENIPINLHYITEGQYILRAEMNGHVFIKRVMLVK